MAPLNPATKPSMKGETRKRTTTATKAKPVPAFHNCLFGTGLPFGNMPHIPDHAQDLCRVLPHSAGVRRMGAAALDLAYVAAGRLDGFWERTLRPWDIAAGLVLLRAATCQVEGWSPGEAPERTGTVITARTPHFDRLAKLLRDGS